MARSSHSGSAAPHPVELPAPVLLPSQVLDKAADLIEPPGAWTQRTYARTASGRPIGAGEEGAVCWCARGALIQAPYTIAPWAGGCIGSARFRAEAYMEQVVPGGNIAQFNDLPQTTQAEVVAAFRKAAELARQEEAGSTPDTSDHGADGEAGSEQQ